MARGKQEPLWIEPLYEGILPKKDVVWQRRFYSNGLLYREIAYIYGLFDCKSNQMVYVGKTTNLESRLKQHLQSTVKDIKDHVEIVPLQVCADYESSRAEEWWIQYARSIGCPLRNTCIPGLSGVYPRNEKLRLIRRARMAVKALKIPDTKEGILAFTEFFEQLAKTHPLFKETT